MASSIWSTVRETTLNRLSPIEADSPALVALAHPSWSSDGQFIVFAGRDQDEHTALYKLRLEDKTAQRIYPSGNSPVWSPSGDRIAFIQPRDDSGSDLYLLSADGSQVCALTDDTVTESNPQWRPQ